MSSLGCFEPKALKTGTRPGFRVQGSGFRVWGLGFNLYKAPTPTPASRQSEGFRSVGGESFQFQFQFGLA